MANKIYVSQMGRKNLIYLEKKCQPGKSAEVS